VPQHRLRRQTGVAIAVTLAVVQLLSPSGLTAAYTDFTSAPRFALPWAEGTEWRLTGGPHGHTGSQRPWSALDFNGPVRGASFAVRAVAPGRVSRPCANLVVIRHANGWKTSYYHLKNIPVRDGQRVQRGQVLGHTSTRAGCGGSASGAHVHFTVGRYKRWVDIKGMRIGGWTVRHGDQPYVGCLVRGAERRCSPSAYVLNFGE
jgi:LasA protease